MIIKRNVYGIIAVSLRCVWLCLFLVEVNGCRTPDNSDEKAGGSGLSDELIARRDKVLEREIASIKKTVADGQNATSNRVEASALPVKKGQSTTAGPKVEQRRWYSFLWPFGKQSLPHTPQPAGSGSAVKTDKKTKDVPVTVASETAGQKGLHPDSATVTNNPSSGKTRWWRPWGGARPADDKVVKETKQPITKDKTNVVVSASKTPQENVKVGHIFDRDARGSFFKRKEPAEKTWRWFGWFRRDKSDSKEPSAKAAGKRENTDKESEKKNITLQKPVKKEVTPETPVEPVSAPVVIPVDTKQVDDIRSGMVAKEPLLKPGFMLKINVLASGRKEVDEPEKRVSPSGTIALPLVGELNVDGMTIRQLANKLKDLYSVYLREPMIDVDFVLKTDTTGSVSPWGYVTVLGRVKKPGRINIPPTRDLALSMAIQLAEGLDSSAKLTGIKITREIAGKVEQFEVNLQSVGDKGELDSDIKLRPGDVVYVPERVF